MSNINFDNPWLFFIGLPILLLLLVPFFITVRKGNRNFHNVTSCILHILITVSVTFAAVGTTVKSVITETNVYVVADLSYSTNKNLDKIDEYIADLEEDLPLNTKLGVVCFGADGSHVVHTRLGEPLTSVRGALEEIDDTSTDIVSALEYTSKIFKGDVVKRIVLITDAKQSDTSDESALKRTVDALHASKVYVDAIYLDSNLAATAKEIQLSEVEVSAKVYRDQASFANVFVQSNNDEVTRATMRVLKDGKVVSSEPIEVQKGIRSIPVALETTESGTFNYTVQLVDIEKDESTFNNEVHFTQTVAAKPSTLFITGSRQDEQLAKEIYGEDYETSVTLKYYDEEIPYTVAELCKYDEIVLSNVNVMSIHNGDMFVESLETVVSLLGKSLVGLGNLSLQNATDETLLRLADMMPVRYGAPVKDQKLYTLIFDMSDSMSQNGRLAPAKKAAKQLVSLLDEKDKVAIIGFYGEARMIQPLTTVGGGEGLKEKIDAIETEHGTVISGGLRGAKNILSDFADEMQTQIFMITDGSNDKADWQGAKDLAKELYINYGATTSVLAIKPNKPSDEPSGANPAVQLQSLVSANYGNGKYWEVDNNTTLDDQVFTDITNDFGDAMVERRTPVNKEKLYDDVLDGVEDVSFVHGYVASREKSEAITVLSAQHRRENASSVTVPIYSYWDYGNGKTSAFLSAFSGEWATAWHESGLDKQFFANVFETNTPKERVDAPFITTVHKQSGSASLEVRPALLKSGATVDVALTLPDGTKTEMKNLAFDSSVYACAFELPSVGAYSVEITYTYKGESYTDVRPIHVSYLSEYDSFNTFDASPLYKMLGGKGTVSEDGNLEIVNDESEVGVRIVDWTVPLLITAVALFAIDVIIRKLKWADIKGLFKKVKKGAK